MCMPCWASLVLPADDCMPTTRIGVVPLIHSAPQVSVSTEQKSWSLPSKRLRFYCAEISVSTKQTSRSPPIPRSRPNPRLGLSRTGQRSRISRNKSLQASQWKSQIATIRIASHAKPYAECSMAYPYVRQPASEPVFCPSQFQASF
jgi:hypothetical protein